MNRQADSGRAVARRVHDVIVNNNADVEEIAKATGLAVPDLKARLAGERTFKAWELVMIGGLFGVPADAFLKGVA